MVILGGLEVVAAGYLLNEVRKDGQKGEEKRRKKRRHDRPHQNNHTSPHRPGRPSHSQSLQLPQGGPNRPTSAPPPQSRPTWPAQPQVQHSQHWQQSPQQQWHPQPPQPPQPPRPQQHWHSQPQHQPQYQTPHPPFQAQVHPPQAQSYYATPPAPPQQQQNTPWIPPAGWHYNMKTGKLVNTMHPEQKAHTRSLSADPLAYGYDHSSSEDETPGSGRRDRSYSRNHSEFDDRRGRQ